MTNENAMDGMKKYIVNQITSSLELKKEILTNNEIINLIGIVAKQAVDQYSINKKIIIAGNGGSAADAQHIAGELVSRFYFDRPGLPAMALTTDTSILTAIGNDYGYENIFSRQIQANGVKDDMFIGISTSGNSPNILKAFEECKKMEIITVGLTGKDGGAMAGHCDFCIKAPTDKPHAFRKRTS